MQDNLSEKLVYVITKHWDDNYGPSRHEIVRVTKDHERAVKICKILNDTNTFIADQLNKEVEYYYDFTPTQSIDDE